MRVLVETYSGYKADERPVRFRLGDQFHDVTEVVDRWYGPDSTYFKVRADDGYLYILKSHPDGWSLEAFAGKSEDRR